MFFKGFRFGMLLQLAVGPVCLFIFQTSAASGVLPAMTGVLGVTIIDALYIIAAIAGIGTLLEKHAGFKKFLRYFGAFVLILFGLANLLGAFDINILPSMNFSSAQDSGSIFLKTLLLTLSNPLTILFWAGVFSTRILEENMHKLDMYVFGTGAVLSTLVFLSAIAVIGSFMNSFLSQNTISFLNALVGALLIFFGIKSLLVKTK